MADGNSENQSDSTPKAPALADRIVRVSLGCEQWLDRVIGGFRNGDEWIEVRPKPVVPKHRKWFPDTAEGLKFAAAHIDTLAKRTRMNVYVGVAARSEAGKGAAAYTASVRALWADLDFKSKPDISGEQQQADAEAKLTALGVPGWVAVHTGGGIHFYVRIEPAPMRTKAEREAVRDVVQALIRLVGGDPVAKDPARVLRAVGTLNHKYTPARVVTAETVGEPSAKPLTFYAAALGVPAPGAASPKGKAKGKAPAGDRRAAGSADDANPVEAHGDAYRLAQGPVMDGEGRHAAVLSLAAALSAAGASPANILRFVRAANERNAKPPKPDDELVAVVNWAISQDADKPAPSAACTVMALLRAGVVQPSYGNGSQQLRGTWLLTGKPLCWSVCNSSKLVVELVEEGLGGLRNFAQSLHSKASDAAVVHALQALTKEARRVDDDPLSERLLVALLAITVLRTTEGPEGAKCHRSYCLSQKPGVYPEVGVALTKESDRWMLAVHLPTAAQSLSKHPDLGFGRRSGNDLVQIINTSPRKPIRKKNTVLSGSSFHLDVTSLLDVSDAESSDPETQDAEASTIETGITGGEGGMCDNAVQTMNTAPP